MVSRSPSTQSQWVFCDNILPKSQITYICQISVILIVISAAIINISLEKNVILWSTLLGSSLGFVLPCPKLKVNRESPQFSV